MSSTGRQRIWGSSRGSKEAGSSGRGRMLPSPVNDLQVLCGRLPVPRGHTAVVQRQCHRKHESLYACAAFD